MKIDYFDLSLDKESHNFYLAGENVNGIIEIRVTERVRISRLSVRLFGNAQTGWRNKLTDKIFESKELILDEYKDLTNELSLHCNEALEIHEGKHEINFTIKLPMDVLSTIEKENYGQIKYICMAVLDVPEGGDSEIVAECEFGVVSFLNLDAPHFQESAESREQVNIIGFFCRRPKGWIRAELIIAQMGLLPGETVRITLTVENTVKKSSSKKHQGVHKCTLLSLCQQLDFRAQSRIDSNNFDEKSLTTAIHSCGTCKANQTKGPETKIMEFEIPAGLPPTSAKCGLIVISYFFRLDMEHFDVVVPVVIGSQKTLLNDSEQNIEEMIINETKILKI